MPELDEFDLQNSSYQLVDDLSEKQVAESDAGLMAQVYGGIQSLLEKQPSKKTQSSANGYIEESKDDSSQSLDKGQNWTEQKKVELQKQLGDKIFNHYYQKIYQHRANPASDESKFREDLKKQVGTNRDLNNLIFELEQVVFVELQ